MVNIKIIIGNDMTRTLFCRALFEKKKIREKL